MSLLADWKKTMRFGFKLLLLGLALVLPGRALATPVQLILENGREPGFGFSAFHAADNSCGTMHGAEWCMNGSWVQFGLEGTLDAELQADGTLTGIHGDITFATSNIPLDFQEMGLDGSLRVLNGEIDLGGDGDSGSIASFLTFGDEEGELFTIYFADYHFSGRANSFDGETLRGWGNSWDALAADGSADIPDLQIGMDIGARVAPIPEPASLGLFSLGALLVGSAIRRKY